MLIALEAHGPQCDNNLSTRSQCPALSKMQPSQDNVAKYTYNARFLMHATRCINSANCINGARACVSGTRLTARVRSHAAGLLVAERATLFDCLRVTSLIYPLYKVLLIRPCCLRYR